ncbi:cytochrome bd oxidase small subunit CydS [Salipaludibacillus sp. HK11]
MDLSWFLIMVASPLIVLASVLGMFVWAAKAKPPTFVEENEEKF